MAEILIGEDDADVRKWLAIALESEGYAVRVAKDGAEALEGFKTKRPDLLILDVMMPKLSGFEVCKAIRAEDKNLPIMMLTARSQESDIVTGFDCGADDYVTKPFSMRILFARVAALLRRMKDESAAIVIGEHIVDHASRMVIDAKGEKTMLTAREYELIYLLSQHRGSVLERDWLLNRLWGIDFLGNTRTLDQHVATLRRKLGKDCASIETVRNVGYMLVEG